MAHAIIFTDRAPRRNVDLSHGYNPAFYSFPAGAYKLASVLREQGLDVLVVPNCLNLTFNGVKKIIKQNSKNLLWVGISSTLMFMRSDQFDNYRNYWSSSTEETMSINYFSEKFTLYSATAHEMAWSEHELNLLAEYLDVPLLVGGGWITHMKNGTFSNLNENVHLVRNYAEKYIEKFTARRMSGITKNEPTSNVHYDNNEFKESKILWKDTDLISPDDWLPLEVARGCAFNCAYCTYPHKGKFDQFKDPKVLREELIRNYEHFGVTNYILMDDLYNDSKTKVRVLHDEVWNNLPFKPEWSSYMRLDMFWSDPESIDIVKASGARMGTFGIETLDNRAGKSVGKGLGKERILETLGWMKEKWGHDVLIQGNFIAGLPYETRESIHDTLEWTKNTDLMFAASWFPMWITPPAHYDIVEDAEINRISRDVDKWEIKWLDKQNWINSAGITYNEVDKLCLDFVNQNKVGGLSSRVSFSFVDYADLRTAGLSHQDILNSRYKNTDAEFIVLNNALKKVGQRVDARIKKILAIKDT